jgi:hypothetical protein
VREGERERKRERERVKGRVWISGRVRIVIYPNSNLQNGKNHGGEN